MFDVNTDDMFGRAYHITSQAEDKLASITAIANLNTCKCHDPYNTRSF